MNSLQATDEKHLIFEDQFEGEANTKRPLLHSDRLYDFWGKRYLCIQSIHDEEFWRFDIFDLLTTESKSVRFQKSANYFPNVVTYFLDYKFMLIVESTICGDFYRFNLVKLNWESDIFEELEHFEREAIFWDIIVDPLNQSKFVLRFSVYGNPIEYQDCKLVNGKIEFGNVHSLSGDYFQYSNGKLIGVDHLNRKFFVDTYNMVDKQEKSFETETIPDQVEWMGISLRKWIVDRVYYAVRFYDSDSYGLMWTDEKTRHWNILNFSTNMWIYKLHFFNGTLIVCTNQTGTENGVLKSNVKLYGIDIHRPQSLRQKAWLLMIRKLKAEGHPDPYKEASKYLPFNTDLRPHWFEDTEEEAPDEQGNDVEDEAVQAKFSDLSI